MKRKRSWAQNPACRTCIRDVGLLVDFSSLNSSSLISKKRKCNMRSGMLYYRKIDPEGIRLCRLLLGNLTADPKSASACAMQVFNFFFRQGQKPNREERTGYWSLSMLVSVPSKEGDTMETLDGFKP